MESHLVKVERPGVSQRVSLSVVDADLSQLQQNLSTLHHHGPNGEMVMNCMDYADDAAMFLLTAQKVVRMRSGLL